MFFNSLCSFSNAAIRSAVKADIDGRNDGVSGMKSQVAGLSGGFAFSVTQELQYSFDIPEHGAGTVFLTRQSDSLFIQSYRLLALVACPSGSRICGTN